jgi:hypothetical protein
MSAKHPCKDFPSTQPARSLLELPDDTNVPIFVYGALKPGMPAFEKLRPFVDGSPKLEKITGELFVRDGLPLLYLKGLGTVTGFCLTWKPECSENAYEAIRNFEPKAHYKWAQVNTESGAIVNVLEAASPRKGNPQPLFSDTWKLTDDPAFGAGLRAVSSVVDELDANAITGDWDRFYKAQMAYLLLWSILERLSALCFGSTQEPHQRVSRIYELDGIAELVKANVHRTDQVSDSRDPEKGYKLNPENPKKCFQYYYQVRSNLSHRGKAVQNEVDKVEKSLKELLVITQEYLAKLQREYES